MFNLYTPNENRRSVQLLQKLQEQEDAAYEKELLRRREQELNDEAIARELQAQLDTDSNSGNSCSYNDDNSSPPPLPNKPLAYSSFHSKTSSVNQTNRNSSFTGPILNSTPDQIYSPQSTHNSVYTPTHSSPLHSPSNSNIIPTPMPISIPNAPPTTLKHAYMFNSMPTPIHSSFQNHHIATNPSSTSISIPNSSISNSTFFSASPVSNPLSDSSFVKQTSMLEPSSNSEVSSTTLSLPETSALISAFQTHNLPSIPTIRSYQQDGNVPPFRVMKKSVTQPAPSTHLSNKIGNLSNHCNTPSTEALSQNNLNKNDTSSNPVMISSLSSLSQSPPRDNMVFIKRHMPTYSDSLLSLKPNEHEDPFSDHFAYKENIGLTLLRKEEKTEIQDNILQPTRHRKSVSEPPKRQPSGPQIANDNNYGYYKEDSKDNLLLPINSDERHITVASINPGLRVWIRIHPRDTGKSLAERIHIIASYKTQKVNKLISQSGRVIPLDNTPIFKNWDEIKEFKEGESWKVEWEPMPSCIGIISESKQFMKQLKKKII